VIESGFCAICVQYGFILTSIEGFKEEEEDFVRWVLQFGIIDFERVLSEKLGFCVTFLCDLGFSFYLFFLNFCCGN